MLQIHPPCHSNCQVGACVFATRDRGNGATLQNCSRCSNAGQGNFPQRCGAQTPGPRQVCRRLNFQVTLALSSRSRRTSLICWRRPRMSRQSGLISRRGYPSFFIWFVQSTCAKPSILRSPFSLLLAISERHFCLYIFGLAGTLLTGAVAAFPATWMPLILFQHFSFLSSTICLLPSNYVYIISLSI